MGNTNEDRYLSERGLDEYDALLKQYIDSEETLAYKTVLKSTDAEENTLLLFFRKPNATLADTPDKTITVTGGGGSGGHIIQNANGVDLSQEDILQFAGYLQTTDNSSGGKTVVDDSPNYVDYSVWETMSDSQKRGKKWIIRNYPESGGGSGGHTILDASGTELPQETNLQFGAYMKVTDDSTNGKTVVEDNVEIITWANYQALTDAQRTGRHFLLTGAPASGLTADEIGYTNTTSQLSATDVQGAIDELKTLIPSTTDVDAEDVDYDNTTSGLTATDAQGAIDELNSKIENVPAAGLVLLSYGHSTWNDFITAYTANRIVYCRASSNSNPGTGSQTRLAFMAYVNNAENPTTVEFQYYRSVSSHSDSQQGDQVFVYTLTSTNGGTWTVTTRNAFSKVVAGTELTSAYSGGTITLNMPTNTFSITAANWAANEDTTTSADYPYIYTVSTTTYTNTSTPIWDLAGAGTILTSAERDEVDKILEAVFTSSGITLYATDQPASDLTLRVKGK